MARALGCIHLNFLVGLSLIVTACAAQQPSSPPTQRSQPFVALNARLSGAAPAVVQGVTFDRLVRARLEPQNWLTYYGAYNGQRYSPLEQINTTNVSRLRPAWVF